MINRRGFLSGMTSAAITLAASSSVLGTPRLVKADGLSDSRGYLTLAEARAIAARLGLDSVGEEVLDLSSYTTASAAALRYLRAVPAGFAFIGLRSLAPTEMREFAAWKTYYLTFSRLQVLRPEAATSLERSECEGHGLCFDDLQRLGTETAQCLVRATRGCPLHVSVPSLAAATADELSSHEHELSVSLRGVSLDIEAARALARHRGYWLAIHLNGQFTDEVRQVFAEATQKEVSMNHHQLDSGPRWTLSLKQTRAA